MDIIGHVRDGVIVLESATALPEGTRVRIQPMTPNFVPAIDPEVAQFAGLLPADINLDNTRLATILEKHACR